MKLCFVYDYVSPAYKAGGPTQSLHNLTVAFQSEAFKIIATNIDLDGSELNVKSDQWLPFGYLKNIRVWYASENDRDINKLIKKGETVFLNSIFSHHFDYVALLGRNDIRKIVSPRGMLDPGSLSQKYWKKKIYLIYWKLKGLHKNCEWHASSEIERQNIQKIFGKRAKIWTIPNFPRLLDLTPLPIKTDCLYIATVSLISPMKNHLLVLKALQQIDFPVQYDIYGPIKNKAYWESCKKQMMSLPANIKVNYHGDIKPDHVPSALAKIHVYVQPSNSENFGHSLYEAMTVGRPVITSHFTPWNKLQQQRAGINVNIEDLHEIESALRFFGHAQVGEIKEWGINARGIALKAIDQEQLKKQYLEMFGAI